MFDCSPLIAFAVLFYNFNEWRTRGRISCFAFMICIWLCQKPWHKQAKMTQNAEHIWAKKNNAKNKNQSILFGSVDFVTVQKHLDWSNISFGQRWNKCFSINFESTIIERAANNSHSFLWKMTPSDSLAFRMQTDTVFETNEMQFSLKLINTAITHDKPIFFR